MPLESLIGTAREQIAPRARSLIVTVMGDSVVPHGGRLWMGNLIGLMAPLGINERLVRTAVQRLTVEDWLRGEPMGRRTRYSLTATGSAQVEAVIERIYAQTPPAWDGQWRMVLALPGAASAEAEGGGPQPMAPLHRELSWMGFGRVSSGLLVHPSADLAQVQALAQRLGLSAQVLMWQAALPEASADLQLRDRVLAAQDMPAVAAIYQQVLALFAPIEQALCNTRQPPPELCFVARSLLIHLYRRALLRDPQFPDALMPADWPGAAARELCRALYLRTASPAQAHVQAALASHQGEAGPPDLRYRRRFGGLPA